MVNKRESLECLFTEINILTECRHSNVVKILDACFDGTLIKEEPLALLSTASASKQSLVEWNALKEDKSGT